MCNNMMAPLLSNVLSELVTSRWVTCRPECVSGGTLASSSPANFGRKKKQVALYFSIGTNGQNSLYVVINTAVPL